MKQSKVRKLPSGLKDNPSIRDIRSARPARLQLLLWRAYWKNHPVALNALRLLSVASILAAGAYFAYRYDLVQLAATHLTYSVIIGTVGSLAAVVGAVRSRRARFEVQIPADDPGHYDLPQLPPGYKMPGVRSLVYLAPGELPGTYPGGSIDPYARRWTLQWPPPTGDTRVPRALQFKFASVLVFAKGNDAEGCHAVASILLRHGENASIALGTEAGIGRLNWYRDNWDQEVKGLTLDERGRIISPTADLITESPTYGLNAFLSNPEITIERGRGVVLPLFYMRENWPYVYLCGPASGITAGKSPDSEPVSFDLKVTLTGLKSRPLTFMVACKARWDNLSIDEPS